MPMAMPFATLPADSHFVRNAFSAASCAADSRGIGGGSSFGLGSSFLPRSTRVTAKRLAGPSSTEKRMRLMSDARFKKNCPKLATHLREPETGSSKARTFLLSSSMTTRRTPPASSKLTTSNESHACPNQFVADDGMSTICVMRGVMSAEGDAPSNTISAKTGNAAAANAAAANPWRIMGLILNALIPQLNSRLPRCRCGRHQRPSPRGSRFDYSCCLHSILQSFGSMLSGKWS